MNLRTKVVLIACTVTVLTVVSCWRIYQSAEAIKSSFITFTNKDMRTLHYLFSVRKNLHVYERLVYEYLASPDRRKPVLVQLTLTQQAVENDLGSLRAAFGSSTFFKKLEQIDTDFTAVNGRLLSLLETEAMDWGSIRSSVVDMGNLARTVEQVLEELFQEINNRTRLSQDQVESRLKEMTGLIAGFIIIVITIVIGIFYFTRETLRADQDRRRLAYFPERSPNPVYSLTLDGDINYANPPVTRLRVRSLKWHTILI